MLIQKIQEVELTIRAFFKSRTDTRTIIYVDKTKFDVNLRDGDSKSHAELLCPEFGNEVSWTTEQFGS